MKASSKKYSLY